jgi:DNA mismatch repair protein MutS
VQIKGNRVRVDRYDDQPDMSDAVVRTFAKFRQGAVPDHRVGFRGEHRMNHVEAQIIELVARLHPEPFSHLEQYRERRTDYLDATVARFDREVQFYLAYLRYIEPLRTRGLQFSLPQVSTQVKEEHVAQAFDLALATSLIGTAAAVVPNDYRLEGAERILVVSGPNNGGKTTFARTFGQLHHLAGLGLPVPGADARLFLPDRIFTHFEREEDIATLRGKFEDELVRIHEILTQATPDSLVVMNESFGSTTLRDALLVGTDVLGQLVDLDLPAVFVTFVDELASLGRSTVSMMSTVEHEDPAIRTFRVIRKPADGIAYAAALADKYGLSYERLRARISR